MDLNLVLSPNPALTGNWRLSAYEEVNPGAEVAFLLIGGAHNTSQTVSLTGLDRVPHYIKLVHVASLTVLHDFSYRPMDVDYTIYMPILFKVGDGGTYTPSPGATEYRNPDLQDKSYWVERRGIGTMAETTEIVKVANSPDFGFDLVEDGDEFHEEETFIIHIHPKRTLTPVNASVAGKWFNGTIEVTASRAYLITDLKNLILFRGSGTTITYTLPAAASVPVGYVFGFQTFGSTWVNHVIASPTANMKNNTGTSVNQLTIGINSFLYIIFNGNWWEIVIAADLSSFTISDNPDENDAAKVASTVATKTLADRIKILATGKFTIGDIPGGDATYSQTFTNPTNANYIVSGSFLSKSSNHARDNTIGWAWYPDEVAPNTKFKITVQELNGETQNVDFCYLVVKI